MTIQILRNNKVIGTLRDGVMTSADPDLVLWSRRGVSVRGAVKDGRTVGETISDIKPDDKGFISAFVDHLHRNGYTVDMLTLNRLARGVIK